MKFAKVLLINLVCVTGLGCLVSVLYFFWPFHVIFESSPKQYDFVNEPIDVVIPAASKDQNMLKYCVDGIKNNCPQVRRIIIVSSHPLIDETEWFDEKEFPFTKADVALYLNHMDEKRALHYCHEGRCGWYFQQLLKFYAPLVIPDISSNVLILDSDVVFFQPVEFLNNSGGGIYATRILTSPLYLIHAQKLLPGLRRFHLLHSGVVHHMIFQKPVLEDLFRQVEKYHNIEFWKAFCLCVDEGNIRRPGASEYEIYFNFAFSRSKQVTIRPLRWINNGDVSSMEEHKKHGYHFVAYHSYLRKLY